MEEVPDLDVLVVSVSGGGLIGGLGDRGAAICGPGSRSTGSSRRPPTTPSGRSMPERGSRSARTRRSPTACESSRRESSTFPIVQEKRRGHPARIRRRDDRDADLDARADEGAGRALRRAARRRAPQEGRFLGHAGRRGALGRQRRPREARGVHRSRPDCDGMTRQVSESFSSLVFSGSALLAHDFWIEPSSFRPAVGSVELRLRVGDISGATRSRATTSGSSGSSSSSAAERRRSRAVPATDPAGLRRGSRRRESRSIGYRSRGLADPDRGGEVREVSGATKGWTGLWKLEPRGRTRKARQGGLFALRARSLVAGGGSGQVRVRPRSRSGAGSGRGQESDKTRRAGGRAVRFEFCHEGKPLAGALVKAIAARRSG